ncbi:YdgA family protein [Methyloversatilis thermotolerans]|uniref:YdgA family protein n=1 Tax=Methyloversatilis thermotolerans TaxID=1346290 RepID=UPI00036A7B42|nr:YdgA family protein [Methyloversatilis thermotolerans]
MKKKLLFALVVALPLAYAGASWHLGQRIEASHDKQAAQYASGLPNVKLIKREYQRGVFSSTETVTMELMGDVARAMADAGQAGMKPLLLTVRTDIRHGPWLGGGLFDAGLARSELVLEGEAAQAVRKVFGDNKPLSVRTVYHFAGGGHSDVDSPAFKWDIASEDPADALQIAWDGLHLEVDFEEGMTRYTMKGQAPRLELSDAAGGRAVIAGMALSGEQARLFDDEPLLYSGSQRFTIDSISVSDPDGRLPRMDAAKLVYGVDITRDGDFIDGVARIASERMKVQDHDYGPAHYDFSMRHLHARTAARLYRGFLEATSDPATMNDPAALQARMGTLMGPAIELLGHAPVLSIDRLSFSTPEGPASLNARVSLSGVTPDDFANPLGLLARLDASGALSLPENLVRGLLVERSRAQVLQIVGEDADPDEVNAYAQSQYEQQIAPLLERGYVTRDQGQLALRLAFAKGQLTVNDKPFDPAALQAPEQ